MKNTSALAVIVEAAVAAIASIFLAVSEQKKENKRVALYHTIDEAQRQLNRL